MVMDKSIKDNGPLILKTCDIKRILPAYAVVVKIVNGLPIYNMQ